MGPVVAELLFNQEVGRVFPGPKELIIKAMADGKVKCLDTGGLRFLTQNPTTPSKWAQMARKGQKIVWVIHQSTNRWVARIINGKLTLL